MRLSRWTRVVLVAAVGLPAAAYGLCARAPRIVLGDASVGDLVWALAGVAGLSLVVAAFVAALRGRRRRWLLALVPAVMLLLQFYALPAVIGGLAVNADRFDVRPATSLHLPGARDVRFREAGGIELAGWYVRGRTDAGVVLAHGSHGSREAVEDHLRLLVRLGYGVLALDARGHGESGGDPNALGWCGAGDVAAAVRFLARRPELDPRRIGAVGISMGGEEALRASAQGAPVAAVVADGAGASTSDDARAAGTSGLALAVTWLSMRAAALFSGEAEPAALVSQVGDIEAPVMLIASNAEGEAELNRKFAERIGDGAQVWHVDDVGHTDALARHPAAYAARLRGFLADAL